MNAFELSTAVAQEKLGEAGFYGKSLANLDIKRGNGSVPISDGTVVNTVAFGSGDAPFKLIEPTPYLTDVTSEHYKLRLKAHQAVLGDEFEVIGIGQYDPKTAPLDGSERSGARKGDFSVYSERVLRVIEAYDLKSAAGILIRGYSFGADVASETAHDMSFNTNRGIANLLGVSIEEAARCENRGGIRVTAAMNASGKRLTDNILASGVPALNEAWGIPAHVSDELAKKVVNGIVTKGAFDYVRSSVRGHVANTRGFGTDRTAEQVIELSNGTSLPVTIHRQADSTVFTESSYARIFDETGTGQPASLEAANDHSRDDNITLSAASVLLFATEVTRPKAA